MADCIIEVGHRSFGRKASWLMDGNPEKPICERHKQQYETAFDDYSHIRWVPISPSPAARGRPMRPCIHCAEPTKEHARGYLVHERTGLALCGEMDDDVDVVRAPVAELDEHDDMCWIACPHPTPPAAREGPR